MGCCFLKKILFRADAAPHIGIGDLMSLISLSKYFSENYIKYFIIKNYKAAVDLVEKYNVKNVFIIDSNIKLNEEINYINNFIQINHIDIIFFEITERKLSDYQGIANIKKVCVNFDQYILEDMDLVINWDVDAYKFYDTKKHSKTKFLLGPEYVILPKEFYDFDFDTIRREYTPKKLLIAMGGADEFNFTEKIVDVILSFKIDIELSIILGVGYANKNELENKLKTSSLKHNIKHNIINMLDEYLNCGIGIGAGGLTSSEMVTTKISTILIATYEHQISRCEYFEKQGWAKYLGFKSFDNNELINAILHPIQIADKNIFNTRAIVDEIEKI
jgi:spore coat polysaccharide biosynthesis predicted glycosyltransferase SpsG